MNKIAIKFFLIFIFIMLSSCSSIKNAGINMISDVMSGEGSGELFTGDNDPELVKDALPFILKMYEMLVAENPDDPALLLATGSTFIMYSNVFIQTPAGMLPDEEFREQYYMLDRSKKMYHRGTEYILRGLELRHKDFRDRLDQDQIDITLDEMEEEDVPYLYWAASGLLGEFSCDPFDFGLGANINRPVAFIYKALEVDESFNNGALHDVLLLINSSLPESLMFKINGDRKSAAAIFADEYYDSMNIKTANERIRYHFRRSVDLSNGNSASPYISLASSVSVKEQNLEEFERLLNTALDIDPEMFPEMRLAGLIYRDKARWLLDHKSDYFLLNTNEGDF